MARLGGGGVYLNVGSAVVLPEVFLKAVTLARNLGHRLADFATANLDFIQGYRPGVNVVERPVAGCGRGYRLTGSHELAGPAARRGARRAGRRPEAAVKDEGTLDELDVADLVQHVGACRFTGRLLLERAEDRVVISVEQGRLVFASSSDPDHRLGPMLLRRGAISLRQMEDAGQATRPPASASAPILVESGVLDPKQLVRGVVDQTREIIL